MNRSKATKNAIVLHHEMYERRCQERAWFHGQSVKQVIKRINTMPLTKRQSGTASNNGQQLSA